MIVSDLSAFQNLPLPYARFHKGASDTETETEPNYIAQSYNTAFGELFGLSPMHPKSWLSLRFLCMKRGIDYSSLTEYLKRNPSSGQAECLTFTTKPGVMRVLNSLQVYVWMDQEKYLNLLFKDEAKQILMPYTGNQSRLEKQPVAYDKHQHFERPEPNQPCSYIYAAPFGTFVTDANGCYLDVNPAASELSGYPTEELLQMHITDIIAPEDLTSALYFHEKLNKTGRNEGEFRLLRKDGSRVWCYISAVKLSNDRFLGFHIDIANEKNAEQTLEQERKRLFNILQGTRVGTWEWNLQTGEAVLNEIWASIIGYAPDELSSPFRYPDWEQLVHPNDLPKTVGLLEKVISGEEEIYECEIRMKHKNGNWVWVHDRGSITEFDSEGKPLLMSGTQSDISERKKFQEDMEQSERHFRALFENHSAVKLLIDPDSKRILDANKAAVSFYGWKKTRLLEMSIPDIMVSGFDEELSAANEPDIGQAKTKQQHLKADGSIVDVEMYNSHIHLDGQLLLHTIVHDNSAIVKAESRLLHEQVFSKAILESAMDGIVACDELGKLKLFNRVAREWHDAEPDGSTPPSWSGRYGLFDSEGKKKLTADEVPLTRAFKGEIFQNALMSIKVPGKEIKYISASGTPFYDNEGRKLGAVVIMRDISDRKALEKQIKLQLHALRSTSNAIAITDRDGTLEWVNPAWEQLTGFTETEAIGQNPRILKSGNQQKYYYEQLWSTLLSGKNWKGELINKRKDGSTYFEYQTITPIFNEENEITHFIAVKQDVTDQKEYEQKLLAQNETLKQIAWHQSHVVRRPVANIMGLIDFIKTENELSESQYTNIRYLEEEIGKLDEIVKKIVQEANLITEGKFSLKK
ncbi:MAG: PAS domain S-box protein [Candidatus Cyclonatronum sp.]|uniref:PAS domain S-box protein n=1 Tax=Cyclonatronum sp. TaxID=3024185 RepID=UPI0025C73796|nr:PAS domain S-box protein [Cyclonatronum sp.]MCH8485978.1 PAS domain S-box protein [Cyclonatronum sp.]